MTALSAEVIAASDDAWDAALGAPHDIYHTAAFHRVAETAGEGRPILVVVRDGSRGLAWPGLLRTIDGAPGRLGREATDLSSVYGYPGPVSWGAEAGDPFLAGAFASVVDAWRARGIVSVFTRFHPLLRNDEAVSAVDLPAGVLGGVLPGGDTISIDCAADDATVRAGYAANLRREVDAARRAGLRTTEDLDWSELPTFARLYTETMTRSDAGAYYFFSLDDFTRLRDALRDHLHLLVTRLGDDVAAAGLFTEFDGIVQTHLVATNEALLRHSPYKVLLDDVRTWARDRGDRTLHLGGGRGGQADSLFWFKSRFSSARHAFHTGRWILDATAYRQLAPDAPAGIDDGYFPAYRG